jgi:hypothetical protein
MSNNSLKHDLPVVQDPEFCRIVSMLGARAIQQQHFAAYLPALPSPDAIMLQQVGQIFNMTKSQQADGKPVVSAFFTAIALGA